MDILGIGPMELILILIVALMVFGPDRLPQIGAKLGRAMRDMRKATRAISDEINSTRAAIEAPVKELAEPFKDVADAAKAAGAVATAARNPGQALRESVMRELNTAVKPETSAAKPADGENTIAPPGAADPLAPPAMPPTDPAPAALPPPGEPLAALPAPEEPLAALPAPEEPLAALPAPQESLAALPAPEERPAESEETDRPSTAPDTAAPTPPEP